MFFYHLHIILINVMYHLQCFQQNYEDFSGAELAPTVWNAGAFFTTDYNKV